MRNNAIKIPILLALCIMTGALCACADRISVDRQIFALGLGVDKGETRDYRFSIIYPEFGGGQTDSTQELRVAMAEADSVQEATLIINTSLAREVNYSHINYIVTSETIARSGALRDVLYQNEQWIPLLAGAAMIAAKGDAQDFLKGFVMNGEMSFDKQQQNVIHEPEKTALFSYCSMFTYMESCVSQAYDCAFSLGAVNAYALGSEEEDEQDETALAAQGGAQENAYALDYLPGEMIRDSGATSEMYGCALFDNERMVGELTGNETQLLMMANGRFKDGYFSLRNVGGIPYLPFKLSARRAPTVALALGDAPKAAITVYLEADMQGTLIRNGMLEPRPNAQSEAAIRTALSRSITDGLYAVGAKCRSVNSDAVMLGKYAIKQFTTTAAWEAYRWKDKFASLTMDFAVDVSLTQYNTRVENP